MHAQVGVERLLKHDLFENMFTMFGDGNSDNTTAKVQPYAPYWSAWLFHRLVGTASVRTPPPPPALPPPSPPPPPPPAPPAVAAPAVAAPMH